jgi:hypothetical protein
MGEPAPHSSKGSILALMGSDESGDVFSGNFNN